MHIIGYKCFNKDLTNRYGMKFKEGKVYLAEGSIKFGTNGNGFHLCQNMEDTLRYFDAMKKEVSICLVKGSGEIVSYFDDYYGYYDMYAVKRLEILKLLSRKEILDRALSLNPEAVKRFLSGFKLNTDEIEIFKNKYHNNLDIIKIIEYYQEDQLDAFVRKRGKIWMK